MEVVIFLLRENALTDIAVGADFHGPFMQMFVRYTKTDEVGCCGCEDEAVEDLMRRAEKVEFPWGETFWDAESVDYCTRNI